MTMGANSRPRPPEDEAEALELLEAAGALLSGHFLLSSGLHSPRYLQCAVALQHPGIAEALGTALARRWLEDDPPAVEAVVSPALGGIIIGHEVGRALGRRAFFTERADGEMTLRRGFRVSGGERILVVEDVVTTGRSTRETLQVLDAAGGRPMGVACLANRSGRDSLAGLPLNHLVSLEFPTYEPSDCPDCAAGSPAVKPGSRS